MMDNAGYDAAEMFVRYMRNGFVYGDKECFIMAMSQGLPEGRLFIWLAIGANCLQRFCELAPHGTKEIGFARGLRDRNSLKWYKFTRFKSLCKTFEAGSILRR